MKFSDGYWMMREGVRAFHPVEVLDVDAGPGSFRVYAPVQRIRHRGDLLRGPVVTVTCESPMPDVIGVTLTHFAGERRRGPHFELATDPAGDVSVDDDAATLTSGALSVRVGRGEEWGVDFLVDGRRLTGSAPKAQAVIDTDDGRHYVREQLDLGVDHFVYGLGERFGPLVKNGQSVDVWNADGGTASEQAYKNVPFFLTNAGYGVFVDHPGRVSFEVASEAVARTQFSVEGQSMRYFVIYGPSPRRSCASTRRSPGAPRGCRIGRSGCGSPRRSPPTTTRRPSPRSSRGWRHATCRSASSISTASGCASSSGATSNGTRACSPTRRGCCAASRPWPADLRLDQPVHRAAVPAVRGGPRARVPAQATERGRVAVGQVAARPGGRRLHEPRAREWYAAKLEALLDMGVDCFKTDFGERIPTDVVYHDGSDPERAHNYYTYLYNQTVFDLLRKKRGESDAVVFARSATTGGQRFPVHWGGDAESTFEAMGRAFAAASPWGCRGSAIGAMTSAVSRGRPTRRCSSGG